MEPINLVDQYCDVWNEPNLDSRRELLSDIWEDKSQYVDPRCDLIGVEALIHHIEKIRSNRPDTKIVRTSVLEVHHHIGRFNWALIDLKGNQLLSGIDIIHFDQSNAKIEKIIGFFGNLESI